MAVAIANFDPSSASPVNAAGVDENLLAMSFLFEDRQFAAEDPIASNSATSISKASVTYEPGGNIFRIPTKRARQWVNTIGLLFDWARILDLPCKPELLDTSGEGRLTCPFWITKLSPIIIVGRHTVIIDKSGADFKKMVGTDIYS